MIRYTHHASREDWLSWRSEDYRIGGTDAVAILRQSPWGGPWSVYSSRKLGRDRRGPDAEAAARGHELEPVALARWSRRTGIAYDASLVTVSAPGPYGWAFASPDALVTCERDGIVGGAEAKTVSRSDLGYLWDDEDPSPAWVSELDGLVIEPGSALANHIPAGWLAQVYWYLACTEARWWDLIILGPHIDQTVIVRIMADEERQALMLRSVEAWRSMYLLGSHVPENDDSDECYGYLKAQWLSAERKVIAEAQGEALEALEAFGSAKLAAKDADAVVKATRATLLDAANEAGACKLTSERFVLSINKAGAMSVKARAS